MSTAKKSKEPAREFTSKELTAMLERMRFMRSDLEEKLAFIRDEARAKHINLDRYFGGTYELTKKEIEAIQEQEKILLDKIAAVTPPGTLLKTSTKNKEKLTQERKGKFRGDRQKWIPVR